MTKYNDYAGVGGTGANKIAILDPNDSMTDPISGISVMREVLTAVGPTPDDDFPGNPTAVREWCINTAVVDPVTKSVLANNEDGKLYRWDLTTGVLSESLAITAGLGQAYTPTILGPDGTVYAVNNAVLFSLAQLGGGSELVAHPRGVGHAAGLVADAVVHGDHVEIGDAVVVVDVAEAGGRMFAIDRRPLEVERAICASTIPGPSGTLTPTVANLFLLSLPLSSTCVYWPNSLATPKL